MTSDVLQQQMLWWPKVAHLMMGCVVPVKVIQTPLILHLSEYTYWFPCNHVYSWLTNCHWCCTFAHCQHKSGRHKVTLNLIPVQRLFKDSDLAVPFQHICWWCRIGRKKLVVLKTSVTFVEITWATSSTSALTVEVTYVNRCNQMVLVASGGHFPVTQAF